MLIRRADEMAGEPVQLEGADKVWMRMMLGSADGMPNFAMRHFTVEPGGHTPRHQHNYEHEVCVLGGSGRVEHDGEYRPIRAGDILFVEPNKIHQFVNDGEEPLTFLCLVPTQFDCGRDGQQPTPGS